MTCLLQKVQMSCLAIALLFLFSYSKLIIFRLNLGLGSDLKNINSRMYSGFMLNHELSSESYYRFCFLRRWMNGGTGVALNSYRHCSPLISLVSDSAPKDNFLCFSCFQETCFQVANLKNSRSSCV